MEAGPSEYKCNHPGCGKGFTRKDHLVRHAANHSHSSYHCQTCHRPFKRLDLLQRHEKRAICGEDGYVRKRPRSESSEDSALAMVHSNLTPTQAMQPSSLDHPYIEVTGPEPIVNHINSNSLATTNPNAETSLNLNLGSNPGANANVNPGVNPNIHSIPAPAPAPVVAATNAPNAPFVVDNSALWGFGQWPLESWEEMWNDVLAPPFGEPAQALNLPFNISTPRMQESAERGGEVSLANAALVVKLQRAFPLLDINLEFIRTSLHHYWSDVAPTFPFIHRGTFDLDAAPPELVMMMVIVGSVHSSHPPSGSPRRDFRITVQEIRGQLVQHCGLDMPISTLQAFCLCHVHDTWYGSRESQFVAQCMWPIMSAHSRKKGIGVAGRPEHDAQEEEAWAAWAKDEERRRAAFCVLLVDTQLSAFWNQHSSRQLSIFAHNLNLPCPRNQWDAPTASEWIRVREPPAASPTTVKKQRPGFMPGLHPEFQVTAISEGYSSAIVSALACQPPVPLKIDIENYLGVEMVLIGLMAAAWDCRTKGNMGIRFRDGAKHWRDILMNAATIELRKTWEASVAHIIPCIETRDMRDTFAISIVSVLCDIPMLQVAAGATSICGSTIGPRQYADAKRRLRLWYKTDDAFKCLWQSARYLRSAIFADWGIYSPWASFVTVLVIWGYAWAAAKDDRAFPPSSTSDGNIKTAASLLLESIMSQSSRPDHLDTGVGDLLASVAERLQGGEEIEREDAGLLWRLCGQGKGRR
ncbi:hypothetical protein EHS25_002766 [Saitozyma podzolica]|uniref:C2H2-type domain-containing protein n=1 Tax=Saitozyma podzolica TaxID=1890683 RepID=A0A427YDA0_9TREE|nr:hypothetical protein EHS25_002766 [Saitozyma podzolica]